MNRKASNSLGSNKIKICFAAWLCFMSIVRAQQKLYPISSELAHASNAEKIYLQLDNMAYNTSQTTWFKAIVTDAIKHVTSKISNVLYVQLIEPENQKIIDEKILKLNKGIAENSFQLHPSYVSGRYQIRAYTEWNKNFGQDFIFKRYIDVIEFDTSDSNKEVIQNFQVSKIKDGALEVNAIIYPLAIDSLHKGKTTVYWEGENLKDSVQLRTERDGRVFLNHTLPSNVSMVNYVVKTANKKHSKSLTFNKVYCDLRFFPESGNLVNGLKSVVGLKALDYKGKGKKIMGEIVNDKDSVITRFENNGLGMGKFELLPISNHKYYGRLKDDNGVLHKYPLPEVMSLGEVLTVKQDSLYFRLKIASNQYRNDSLFVQIKQRGVPIYLVRTKLKNGERYHIFRKSVFPAGINECTVYTKNGKPLCERLVYNEKPNERINIALKTDRAVYEQRDSTNIAIQVMQDSVSQMANLSVMVVDSTYFKETNMSRSNILSYFLLESELRGEIENPGYYFENETPAKDLDVLLLTQGWRRYKYDKPKRTITIQPEKTLKVAGYVGGVQNKKRGDKTLDLVMMVFGDQVEFRQTRVDSTGKFEFNIPETFGEGRKVVFQTTTVKGKKKDVPVRLIKKKELPIVFDAKKNIVPIDSIVEQRVTDAISEIKASDPFEILPNTIELDEVTLSGYKITPERQKMVELHGLPKFYVENKELTKKVKPWTTNLFSLLHFNYGDQLDIRRVGGVPGFQYASVHGADFTYVLVDGIPVQLFYYNMIENIRVSEVKSVEIIRSSSANRYTSIVFERPPLNPPPFPAILAIYTYAGKGLFGAMHTTRGIVKDQIPEFAPEREFYAPDHATVTAYDWQFPDLRKLVHWKPNLNTDHEGKTTVGFYNGDVTGKMLVIIEGITPEGKLGYQEMIYEVIEKEKP